MFEVVLVIVKSSADGHTEYGTAQEIERHRHHEDGGEGGQRLLDLSPVDALRVGHH